eukprot:s147_g29.t1
MVGPCTSTSSPPHPRRTSPERIRRAVWRRWEHVRRDRGATDPPADTPPGRPGSTVSLVDRLETMSQERPRHAYVAVWLVASKAVTWKKNVDIESVQLSWQLPWP